jgi:predicted nucleotidyltransferase
VAAAKGAGRVTTNDVMLLVADALNREKIPAMLVGSFSSNYYGIPRSTEDVDFVIQIESNLTADFAQILGAQFEAESQLSFETNTGTQKQEFNVKGTGFKLELFKLSDDAFDQQRFKNRRRVMVAGREVWFPRVEDVIVMKLRWGRTKDKEDVKDVMHVQRGKLDWNYIEDWCRQHGSLGRLLELRKEVEAKP